MRGIITVSKGEFSPTARALQYFILHGFQSIILRSSRYVSVNLKALKNVILCACMKDISL
jgi:hypothetical protein